MDTDDTRDLELVARLKRLDASGANAAPAFDYDRMLERHAAAGERLRRRRALARGTASALVFALVGASVWRIEGHGSTQPKVTDEAAAEVRGAPEPRIVRADTYLALAALEDRIASVDDALSVARSYSPRGAEVARLERTRAELLDSYAQVRYADLVSANY
jgi:hypothetical protein